MAYARLLGDIVIKHDTVLFRFKSFRLVCKIIDKRNGEDIAPRIKQLIFQNGFALPIRTTRPYCL